MGTRNLTIVFYKGKYRIVQYGQWDGAPYGQGSTIYTFLKNSNNIETLKRNLDASDTYIYEVDCKHFIDNYELTDAEQEDIVKSILESRPTITSDSPIFKRLEENARYDFLLEKHPSLSRDTGAKILDMAIEATEEKRVPIHLWSLDFLTDRLFCEWAYVLDLDKNVLEAYSGWDQAKIWVPELRSRFHDMFGKECVGLVRVFRFDALPATKADFVAAFEDVKGDGDE